MHFRGGSRTIVAGMTAILALLFAFARQAATPLKGIALVIGQSKYQHLAARRDGSVLDCYWIAG
jgi:hypothetical protein